MNSTLQKYVDELVEIGTLRPGNPFYGEPGYDSTFNTTGKDTARAVGQKIYAYGGHSAMLEVAYATVARMGKQVQIELNYCWHGIGEWRS